MRFLICDDHKVFADSLALLIERSGWQVVGIAADPGHAADLLSEGGVDVCLMDLSFPSGSALDRLPELCEQSPGTKFVVLTGFADAATLDAVMAAGAHGVAHKGNEVSDLLDLLRTVIAGGKVVQPALLSMSAHRAPSSQSTARRLASFLTSREREVLCSLVRGANVVSLAKELGVARSTARSHVQSVLTKLGVHSQREAVIVAARHGLVSVDTGEWLAD